MVVHADRSILAFSLVLKSYFLGLYRSEFRMRSVDLEMNEIQLSQLLC